MIIEFEFINDGSAFIRIRIEQKYPILSKLNNGSWSLCCYLAPFSFSSISSIADWVDNKEKTLNFTAIQRRDRFYEIIAKLLIKL